MTTEQAIAIIQEYLYRHRYGYISKNKEFDSLYNAMQVVIQALQAQEDGDLISRQALLKQPLDTANYPSNYVRNAPPVAIPSALTTEEYTELRDRFGAYVEFVVKDMVSGKGERWERKGVDIPSAEPYDFAKWVASEIFDDMWEYNKDAFAEIACRKLEKMGIVRAKGDEWELVEEQKSEG